MIRNFAKTLIAALFAMASLAAQATDVNRASQADLEAVKGIGPGLSGKIIKARESGAFKNWGDFVERVGGVGPGNAARFSQAGLTVGGAAFDAKDMPAAPMKADKPMKAEKADKADKPAKPAKKSEPV
jgi:competence protein ComEA